MSKPILPTSQNTQNNAIRTRATLLEHRPTGGAFEIKVFAETATVTVGDGAFILFVAPDLAGCNLSAVSIGVTTVSSSGSPTVQLRNITQSNTDLLSTKASVAASSFFNDTNAVIDQSVNAVAAGDRIAFDVDVAGTGAKGLTMMLEFS